MSYFTQKTCWCCEEPTVKGTRCCVKHLKELKDIVKSHENKIRRLSIVEVD